MPRFRSGLPQLDADRPYLTDGGLETDLVFHHGIDLPAFAAFPLLDSEEGLETLSTYAREYLTLARDIDTGFVLGGLTWRANADWGEVLGYSAADLDRVNRDSIAALAKLRDEFDDEVSAIVLSGCIGPRGDGYVPGNQMSAAEAEAYHRPQIETLADTEADMIEALTLSYVNEAIGIARAAKAAGIPSVISFTVETDGRLPSGQTLADAVRQLDAETDAAPAYLMINCAHPTHFLDVLDGDWTQRIRAIRANASTCSHAELDEAEVLDEGDPGQLASAYRELAEVLDLAVVGGCCGTDVRHVGAISGALLASPLP